jgi:hypothetical protein
MQPAAIARGAGDEGSLALAPENPPLAAEHVHGLTDRDASDPVLLRQLLERRQTMSGRPYPAPHLPAQKVGDLDVKRDRRSLEAVQQGS